MTTAWINEDVGTFLAFGTGGAEPSHGGTSRIMREYHVRICDGRTFSELPPTGLEEWAIELVAPALHGTVDRLSMNNPTRLHI
jgi:hypothetical protein